jgi:NADH:ubiquinone oxidoreductase subunit 3 (subunit A)
MRQKKGFSFNFYFFSLKFLYFDLKYYFIYILVIKFESGERGSLENNKRENNQLPSIKTMFYFFI